MTLSHLHISPLFFRSYPTYRILTPVWCLKLSEMSGNCSKLCFNHHFHVPRAICTDCLKTEIENISVECTRYFKYPVMIRNKVTHEKRAQILHPVNNAPDNFKGRHV